MVEIIKRLISTKKLKLNRLREHARATHVLYDRDCDTFLIQIVPPSTETVVHYLDDQNVALVYEAKSNEIVGLQVEGFTRNFLAKHANVEDVWRHTIQIRDFGDLSVQFKRMEPLVAKAIFLASRPVIEQKDAELAEMLGKSLVKDRNCIPA